MNGLFKLSLLASLALLYGCKSPSSSGGIPAPQIPGVPQSSIPSIPGGSPPSVPGGPPPSGGSPSLSLIHI